MKSWRWSLWMGALVGLCALGPRTLPAEVVRLTIEQRQPFAEGQEFGTAGPYEQLRGRIDLELDPQEPANVRVADLALAPRNARGKIEFWVDFQLLMPKDPQRGNHRLVYDVNNRGGKPILGALGDSGNPFLFRQGYTLLWSGWNGDVAPGEDRLAAGLPTAQIDGQPIQGRVYSEILVNAPCQSQPIGGRGYPSVTLDHRTARLTVRRSRREAAVEVPHERWAFAHGKKDQPEPDPNSVWLQDGFEPGCIYELVYTSQGPRVTGLGLAAVRDVVAFFRSAAQDQQGQANPLAGSVRWTLGFGISQSGRFLRHFLYEGFNRDLKGHPVFDGLWAHVAGGGRGMFNSRFAQTTRYSGQFEDTFFPIDGFPFATIPQTDPFTGAEDDLLGRARQQECLPKIFFTDTSAEYWTRAASLVHTDVTGTKDVAVDPHVRIYCLAGGQHGVSSSTERGECLYPRNILDHRPPLRALLVALDRWVSEDAEPPASQYPRIADGTLVTLEVHRASFPAIPGVQPPEVLHQPFRLDWGPRWLREGIADTLPPLPGPCYISLVPAVDADGNPLAGVRLPDVAVPLGTYTGWNLRGPGLGGTGNLIRCAGAYFAFPRTAEERQAQRDPRLAVLERYPSQEDYLARMQAICAALERDRFLLPDDTAHILQVAAQRKLWEEAGKK